MCGPMPYRVSDQIMATTYIRTNTLTTRAMIITLALARSPGQMLTAYQVRTGHAQNHGSYSMQEIYHCLIITNLGRVCQVLVDRFSSINKSAASCHDWGAVSSNLPLLNVQISDTSDIDG